MSPRKAMSVCTVPGCPALTAGGRCPEHQRAADQARGTAAQRGYGRQHRIRFRAKVLARDPVCVICRQEPSVVADHYPMDRRELVAKGLNPNDPQYGRGLCKPCDSRQTAERQPGGWNAR